ncbi:MAG: hybrid sensor histidine kinase/response regulator, partial [Planctomycetes bacterium]|nr:hybrid sensor histidine kinase/response regulator [Planctomycetota bacterium]
VCEELKSDETLKNIPIIFLSALSETMIKVKAFGAGGVDYITKPFHFEEVEARVDTHLKLCRQKLQLQDNYDKLCALEGLRDSLMHMLMHDLLSPLAVIHTSLEVIQESMKKASLHEALQFVDVTMKSATRMVQMINDILNTSKMESGQMKLTLSRFDMAGVVEEAVSDLQSISANRKIRFANTEKYPPILADREIIYRVLQNLLANAFKFTRDAGLIQLDIELVGEKLRVIVKDNGYGIAPEYRQQVFEKFAQVEIRAVHQKHSTGLGLTFCKLAVEAHGGSIGVDSEEEKGCSFWFELPVNGSGSQAPKS